MVGLFLKAFAGHSGSFSCCFEQLFCREPVSTCLCRQNTTWDVISGVLKTRRAEGCSSQACNLLKKNSIRDPLPEIFCMFQSAFKNLVRSSFLVALHNVYCKSTARNKPVHKFEFSWNAEISSLNLLKKDSTTISRNTQRKQSQWS